MRALDQRRPLAERILDDPYAELFLGPISRGALAAARASGDLGLAAERHALGLITYVLTRHRFIDDALQAALSEGRIEQVVLLGAGYDTRAYRFGPQASDVQFFEVDHPSTGGRKARIVAVHADRLPPEQVTRVQVDFEHERFGEKLVQAGLRPGAPTFFVWEGVSMYLSREAVKSTLETIHALGAPGSELAMDFFFMLDQADARATALRTLPGLLHFLGEPVTFAIHPEDAGGFLGRLGFELIALADGPALESRYVRDGRHVYPTNYVVHARTR